MSYIVTHNRDRDFYQVPLALAEAGKLDYFVTDYYEGKGLSIPSLNHRKVEGIELASVVESKRAFLAQLPYEIKRRINKSTDFPTLFVERNLGKTVAKVAAQNTSSDLLLYTGSAYWAFKEAPSDVRKNLFVYQVAPEYLNKLIDENDELKGYRNWLQEAEQVDPKMLEHHQKEVAISDNFFCASTVTKRSLIDEGIDNRKIFVSPYGVPSSLERINEKNNKCTFLFAGQGIARKGLHILIEAWRQAKLRNSELTIITSRTDPEILNFAQGLSNIKILDRQPHEQLLQTMAQHDTFVMPSLVEGFGLVYGEALAAGCRLIGTDNTGMYDMALDTAIGSTVEAGKIQPLVDALKKHEETYDSQRRYYELIREETERLSWDNFRKSIRTNIAEIEGNK